MVKLFFNLLSHSTRCVFENKFKSKSTKPWLFELRILSAISQKYHENMNVGSIKLRVVYMNYSGILHFEQLVSFVENNFLNLGGNSHRKNLMVFQFCMIGTSVIKELT